MLGCLREYYAGVGGRIGVSGLRVFGYERV